MFDIEPRQVCEIVTVVDDSQFREFLSHNPNGLTMVAEDYGHLGRPVLKADAGDLAKWLKVKHPEIDVQLQSADRLELRSSDWWLPLVFLASDVTLPVFLNLVSSYIFDKMKGALKGDKPRVHLSAEYQDPSTGLIKRFDFEGEPEALRDAVQKLDLNKFFHG